MTTATTAQQVCCRTAARCQTARAALQAAAAAAALAGLGVRPRGTPGVARQSLTMMTIRLVTQAARRTSLRVRTRGFEV
jgi:hypothetical protein